MSTGTQNQNQTDQFDLDLSGTQGADDLDVGREPVGPGIYHVGIADVELAPLDAKHQPITNAFLRLQMEVLAGAPANEIGKKFSTIFFRPDPTATGDEQRWKFNEPRNLLARLGMAAGAIPAGSFGKSVRPEWANMSRRHFVIKLYRKKSKDPTKDGFLAVGNVWHVASAEISKFVDVAMVQEFPMGPDTLASGVVGASGNSNGQGGQVGGQSPAGNQPSDGASSAVETL